MQKLQANNVLVADLSHYQGDAQFIGFETDGVRAATFKATQGIGYIDPNFAVFTVRARAAQVPFSAYHFAEPNKNHAVDEAKHFANQWIGAAVPSRIGWLDLEDFCDGMAPDQVADWVLTFEQTFKSLTGTALGFYSNVGFIQKFNGFNNRLSHMPLWIADYPGDNAVLANFEISDVGGWTDWVMWQFKDNGMITGVPSLVDMSYARSLDAIGFSPCSPMVSLNADAANYTIRRFLSRDYDLASDGDKKLRAYLADTLRVLSGQEPHNSELLNLYIPDFPKEV